MPRYNGSTRRRKRPTVARKGSPSWLNHQPGGKPNLDKIRSQVKQAKTVG